jgi:uncharacterized protein (DUF2236 family)
MAPRLTDEQARALTLTDNSVSWRVASDARGFLAAGYALMLQVAHPTVSSGVRDHSNFLNEPWARLWRTVDYVNLTVYAGQDAIEVTRRLRELHRSIKGGNPDGTKYHALEPEAYAWVQGTLVYTVVTANARFVKKLSTEDTERLYREWVGLGRLLGVREGDLPADWAGFLSYFNEMVETRLKRTETGEVVLRSIAKPPRPDELPKWTEPLWRVASLPLRHLLMLCTVGMLPPVLRERYGLRWTWWQERELRAITAVSRALTPILPGFVKITGPRYLTMRARALRHNPLVPRESVNISV